MKYKPVIINRAENDFLECEDCGAVVLADPVAPRGRERPIGNMKHTMWHNELRMRLTP